MPPGGRLPLPPSASARPPGGGGCSGIDRPVMYLVRISPPYTPVLSYSEWLCVTMVGMERMRVLSVRVPVGFWVRCQHCAEARGLGLSEWVRLVLWEALEGSGGVA